MNLQQKIEKKWNKKKQVSMENKTHNNKNELVIFVLYNSFKFEFHDEFQLIVVILKGKFN